ncbi:hypothetical protein HHI36_020578 [Cryptolaemus montrouzieri]|uniref:ZAD domain-containing protein n=1 Tax=Cryptolaemus montrouzieri TaxID=559131 RepID=A0ABD2NAX0_9CUCU
MSEIDEPAVPTVMKEITYDNFSKICRSCIINRGEIDVFEAHMQNVPLSNVIFSCTNELVTKTDGLSRVICNICMKLLINSYTFVKTFKESQVNLMNMHKVFKNKNIL